MLIDKVGQRRERFESESLVLDPAALKRLSGIRAYWEGAPSPRQPFRMPRWRLFGEGVSLRPRLVLGRRVILSEDKGIRDHQRSWHVGISL